MDTIRQKLKRLSISREAASHTAPLVSAPDPDSRPTLNDDVLRIIFSHLSKADILSCLLVDQQWSHSAGIALYSSDTWVIHGRNGDSPLFSPTPKPPTRSSTFLSGVKKRPLPRPPSSSSKPAYILPYTPGIAKRSKPKIVPPSSLLPSSMKLELLSHVRHLHYYPMNLIPLNESLLPEINLFPSLDTITLYSHTKDINWEDPFLQGIRPKHVRLPRIPTLESYRPLGSGSILHYIPPGKAISDYQSCVKKVTIHFVACLEPPDKFRPQHQNTYPMEIEWPKSMIELDLVFLAENKSSGTFGREPKFDGMRRASPIYEDRLGETSMVLARLILSALKSNEGGGKLKEVKVRVIGLGGNFIMKVGYDEIETDDDMFLSPNVLSELLGYHFRDDYEKILIGYGLNKEEAVLWAKKVEFVHFYQYFKEERNMTF